MTPGETAAFNAGVRAVLTNSRSAARAIEARPGFQPTRHGFAVAALDELADAGEMLIWSIPEKPSHAAEKPNAEA